MRASPRSFSKKLNKSSGEMSIDRALVSCSQSQPLVTSSTAFSCLKSSSSEGSRKSSHDYKINKVSIPASLVTTKRCVVTIMQVFEQIARRNFEWGKQFIYSQKELAFFFHKGETPNFITRVEWNYKVTTVKLQDSTTKLLGPQISTSVDTTGFHKLMEQGIFQIIGILTRPIEMQVASTGRPQ